MKKQFLKKVSTKLLAFVKDRQRYFGEVSVTFDQLAKYGLRAPKHVVVIKENQPLQITNELDVKGALLSLEQERCKFEVRINVPFGISDGVHTKGFILKQNKTGVELLPCEHQTQLFKQTWNTNRTVYYFGIV